MKTQQAHVIERYTLHIDLVYEGGSTD